MIIELIVNLIVSTFSYVLSLADLLFDGINIVFPVNIQSWFIGLVNDVWYFLPMTDLIQIFFIWIALTYLNLLIAIFKFLWGLLPLT